MAAKRSRNKEMLVFSANVSLGWRVVRGISFQEGERRVDQGVFLRVNDELGRHVGYQPLEDRRTDRNLPSKQTPVQLTATDARAIAGEYGASRTKGLSEDDRLDRRNRFGKLLEAEDFVERAIEKVKVFTRPAPGRGDRAVRVYPREQNAKR